MSSDFSVLSSDQAVQAEWEELFGKKNLNFTLSTEKDSTGVIQQVTCTTNDDFKGLRFTSKRNDARFQTSSFSVASGVLMALDAPLVPDPKEQPSTTEPYATPWTLDNAIKTFGLTAGIKNDQGIISQIYTLFKDAGALNVDLTESRCAMWLFPGESLQVATEIPGGRDLPGVEAEEEDISSVVKDPHSVLPLKQPSADTVLDRLKDFSIAHFACHGSADLTDPSNSFLALQGNSDSDPDKLTVQMISGANLGQAWLAYLSACSTAEIKVSDLADEVLHLATSFQVAGFGHVVASMWPSNDAICAQVARLFYQDLLTKGGIERGNRAVPAALHAAVAEVRSQNLERPYLWAQYIHSGA
jgi:hypothetical protein